MSIYVDDAADAHILAWAIAVIEMDGERDNIGLAALTVLAAYQKLLRGEFICKQCGIRKDAEPNEPATF